MSHVMLTAWLLLFLISMLFTYSSFGLLFLNEDEWSGNISFTVAPRESASFCVKYNNMRNSEW